MSLTAMQTSLLRHRSSMERERLLSLAAVDAPQQTMAWHLWQTHAPLSLRGLLDGDGWRWDPQLQGYRGSDGQIISGAKLKRLALLVADAIRKMEREKAAAIAGGPSFAWLYGFAGEIAGTFNLMAALAVGGFPNFTRQMKEQVVGGPQTPGTLAFSMARLARWGSQQEENEAVDREPVGMTPANRAAMYVDSAQTVYEAMRREIHRRAIDDDGNRIIYVERNILDDQAKHCHSTKDVIGCPECSKMGWVKIGTMPLPGLRQCRNHCRCWLDYSVEVKTMKPLLQRNTKPLLQLKLKMAQKRAETSRSSVLTFGYDPNEPRDQGGEWTTGGGRSSSGKPTSQPSPAHAAAASPAPRAGPLVQPHNTPHELFGQAAETKPMYDNFTDSGVGVSKDIGAKTFNDYDKALAHMKSGKRGPVVLLAGLKGQDRSAEKVHGKYAGNWNKLHDIVRGTIAVDHPDEIPRVMAAVKKNAEKTGFKIVDQEDKFAKPSPAGYRDLSLKVMGPNGHIGELQVNTKAMMLAKDIGHLMYEEARSIDDKAKAEKRDLTADEAKRIEVLNQQQAVLYAAAWKKSQQGLR